jgi:hypothetical protein
VAIFWEHKIFKVSKLRQLADGILKKPAKNTEMPPRWGSGFQDIIFGYQNIVPMALSVIVLENLQNN